MCVSVITRISFHFLLTLLHVYVTCVCVPKVWWWKTNKYLGIAELLLERMDSQNSSFYMNIIFNFLSLQSVISIWQCFIVLFSTIRPFKYLFQLFILINVNYFMTDVHKNKNLDDKMLSCHFPCLLFLTCSLIRFVIMFTGIPFFSC